MRKYGRRNRNLEEKKEEEKKEEEKKKKIQLIEGDTIEEI